MTLSVPLILVLIGFIVWFVPSRFSEAGKWTFVIALAAYLFRR